MTRRILLPALVLCLPVPAASRGADPAPRAAEQAKSIAPYLDANTIVVGRLDLTKVDVAAAFQFLQPYVPAAKEELQKVQQAVQMGFLDPLKAQRVREMYLVISLDEFPNGKPTVIVPVGKGGSHRKVAGLMFSGNPDGPTTGPGNRRSPFEICTQMGDVVFCGSLAALKRAEAKKPSPRPHLEAAFESVEGAAVQLLFLPSKDHRRVVSELFPKLPKEFGGMTGKEVAGAVQWASLGIHLPPKLKAEAFVQSDTAADARKLKATLIALARFGSKQPLPKGVIRPEDVARLPLMLKPAVHDSRLQLSFDADSEAGKQIARMFSVSVRSARKAAQRSSSKNNLRQLGLAMHNFHDTYRGFPPVASFKNKKKLLSWRVYLLPFLEANDLFKQFHLDEPWDSEHNRKLIARMPKVFADPSGRVKKPGMTRYLAPVGPKAVFTGKEEGIQIKDIIDGTSNTIMLVEAAPERAVVWTKPDDLPLDDKDPLKGLLGKGAESFQALFADGSVRVISKNIEKKVLKALFTRNGGEAVGSF